MTSVGPAWVTRRATSFRGPSLTHHHGVLLRLRVAAGAHADRLVALERLALRLECRGDHQLGPVELGDVLVAAGRHRGPQAAHQVERAVVLAGGTGDDLLERAVLGGRHAGPA